MLLSQKECVTCGESKNLSEFYRQPGKRDGHQNECKECVKERVRLYRRTSSKPKDVRKPTSGRPNEQMVIDKLRSEGIYAVAGSATQYRWAWGCIPIETKLINLLTNNYFAFTPRQRERGIQGDFIIIVCLNPKRDETSYHLFPATHPIFYEGDRLRHTISYSPNTNRRRLKVVGKPLTIELMRQHENAWHLIEERRLEIQRALRGE